MVGWDGRQGACRLNKVIRGGPTGRVRNEQRLGGGEWGFVVKLWGWRILCFFLANDTSQPRPQAPQQKELRFRSFPCSEVTGLLSWTSLHPPWFETSEQTSSFKGSQTGLLRTLGRQHFPSAQVALPSFQAWCPFLPSPPMRIFS